MSERRAPALRLAILFAFLTSAAILALGGCKKEQPAAAGTQAAGRRGGAGAAGGQMGEAAGARGRGGRGGRGMRGGPQGGAAEAGQGAGMRGGRGGMGGRRGGRQGAAAEPAGPAGAARPGPAGGRRGRAAVAAEAGAKAAPGGGEAKATAEGGKPAEGVVMTAAQVPVSTKGATTGILEVDKMRKIRDFAAVFGPTTLIRAQDQNGTELEWIAVTPDSGKEKGRQVVMPLSMLMTADYPEALEGYFPIYVRGARPLGKVVSKATVTEPRRPKKDLKKIRDEELAKKRKAAATEQAAGAESEAGAYAGATGRGGMGGGMRGGRGGMGGMRGGRGMGGGMRGGRGGMGGGMRGGRGGGA